MMFEELSLSVFTLNLWGLPKPLTSHKDERINAIGKALKTSSYDIVCLQEVWDTKDYDLIHEETIDVLPHSHYFHSGVTGSGLCILSKWPIQEVLFYQWPLNGYMHMIHHGDWFGGKGVGLAQISINGLLVNVYTAHLHAEYDRRNDPYLAHRVVQAFDTSTFVRMTSGSAHITILAGDFNAEPGDICQRLLKNLCDLQDSFDASDENIIHGTNESVRNSFSCPQAINRNPSGSRIDYILFKATKGGDVQTLKYYYPLEDRIPGTDYSYSDHEAVAAVLKYESNLGIKDEWGKDFHHHGDLEEAIEVCSAALIRVKKKTVFYLGFSTCTLLCFFLIPFFSHFMRVNLVLFLSAVILMTVLCIFTILMGTVWHFMETKALTGAIMRMRLLSPNNDKEN